jgi:CubicO group peptidase (beta-lactamase class C family)
MKVLKRIGQVVLVLIIASVLGLWISGNGHVLRGLRCTYLVGVSKPDIDDMNYFDLRKMPADQPEVWAMKNEYNLYALSDEFLRVSDSLGTVAYLVFHQDSLLFEKYWKKNTDTTHFNSFSMAKSFTALLVGIAIDEGYIKSLDQKVSDFIPEYAEGKSASLTIRHLLQMASGIPFGESYSSPFGFMAKAYYGRNMNELTLEYRVEKEPGSFWAYEGGNTILLGMILKKATGRTVADYFFQKVWSCIGSEQPAYWNLDNYNGNEKTYTGFYATARDFARIGKLYAHQGVWDNDTLVSPSFVQACLQPNGVPDEHGDACSWYGLHWWIGEHEGSPYFSCRGLRGQYVVVLPEEKIMMVRIGHQQSKERENHMPKDMSVYIREAKRMVKK